MVMWERLAGPAGGNDGCAGQVMYDVRHEPNAYLLLPNTASVRGVTTYRHNLSHEGKAVTTD
jgi:CDP-diacylglycerol pyrophosphatase